MLIDPLRVIALHGYEYCTEELTFPVEFITVQLNKSELDSLAKRTRLIINCVGPYHLFSTPVVEACAQNGTHYVDM